MTEVLLYVLGVLILLVGLAVSIGLHEVGHLLPAKLFGVKVTQYMIGFGKTLWSKRKGETEYGVKLIPLGGYVAMTVSYTHLDVYKRQMPLRYGSELAEHRAVREAAGLFDLSHMGEVWVSGPDAATFLNTALVGNLAVIAVGKAKYSLIVNEQGGIIDDLIVYRLSLIHI